MTIGHLALLHARVDARVLAALVPLRARYLVALANLLRASDRARYKAVHGEHAHRYRGPFQRHYDRAEKLLLDEYAALASDLAGERLEPSASMGARGSELHLFGHGGRIL